MEGSLTTARSRGMVMKDSKGFDSLRSFSKSDGTVGDFHSLSHLQELGLCDLDSLPYTIRLLLELLCESAMVFWLPVRMSKNRIMVT